jgi:hypothetical protein
MNMRMRQCVGSSKVPSSARWAPSPIPSEQEKAIICETVPFARSPFSEWEKVAEGRMRAPLSATAAWEHTDSP